ncbi:alpha/beta hydrolase-fold protein [Oceanobacillus sp. HCA-5259]|uniref:alpha/beta hydrolase n=1 Tax=Oceanobacillus sp. HCA-5259 TaxID=3134661 RepID=UPI0030BBD304
MARKGKMIDKEIESKYLDETKVLKIYYPESFSDLYKYNICIMFDGDDYYQMGRIATYSDRLHEDYELTNTIFVGIHYKDAEDRRRKYHPNGNEYDAFTKFVVKEVVPLLDDLLPTYHMGKSRILMGDSLAGTFSLLTALRYPNTFGKVILQSPFIDEAVMEQVKQAKDHAALDIYHTIGEKENEAKLTDGRTVDQLTPNRELRDFLEAGNSNYFYYELEDGEHTWKYWQKDMIRALTTTID